MSYDWQSYFGVLARLIAAVAAGALVGFNRYLHHKPAGFGTHALVSLGAALATLMAIRAPGSDAGAVSRVMQGLVTGVGFIGAGVIMRSDRDGDVHGLTTAASIWICAIFGMGCGAAEFSIGASGVALAIVILVLNKPFEDMVSKILKRRHGQGPSD